MPRGSQNRIPWMVLAVTFATGIALGLPTVSRLFEYDREALRAGQFWRLVTAHGMHWDLRHWFWDAAVFAVLGAACERRSRGRLAGALVGTALAVSAAVWTLQPELGYYRGLSGLDSMLLVWFSLETLRLATTPGQRLGILTLLTLAFAKLGWEWVTQQTLFVPSGASGMVAVPLAHAVGALCGVLLGSLSLVSPRRSASRAALTPGG